MNKFKRVIPRDFFNEAKLLKCLGKLELKAMDNIYGLNSCLTGREDKFDIRLSDDGQLVCVNYELYLKLGVCAHQLNVYSPYNSENDWPLMCELMGETVSVFNNDGTLTSEFTNWIDEDKDLLEVDHILTEYDLELVSYGLAPNPWGFCYERGDDVPAEIERRLNKLLEGLNTKQCELLKGAWL